MFIRDWFKRIPRNIRYTYQLWTRGWCDCETWNLNRSIAKNILPRLKAFRRVTMSYPPDTTEGRWDLILAEMIEGFEIVADEERFHSMNEKDLEKVKHSLDLFRKWYLDLWS